MDAYPLDVAQEEQRLDVEVAQGGGDLPDGDCRGDFGAIEREHEDSPGAGFVQRLDGVGPDVLLDPEVLAGAVDPRAVWCRRRPP